MRVNDLIGFLIFMYLGIQLTIFNKSFIEKMLRTNSTLFGVRKSSVGMQLWHRIIGYILGLVFIVGAIFFLIF